ncbi:Tripartite-type tricarboxylate transporter, receptor component TctC [Oryzisolibacter propanilivorax]|uniref:Tripartite-type tricarboxylate transporter, receptor component TctC n=1 Tax=Oryzisolibacter propanilivorax TaxID=1527607 RepID=A0A1G9VLL8_9BURK|nr:tripartite tricarboxylate transporter substrate binding protein [Oryzisolibacter propanilivorax]SDM72997.1 Tripartite-type tricarboxylate transporter, receptor component TctC [Oryzisolibacter propanilivorax]
MSFRTLNRRAALALAATPLLASLSLPALAQGTWPDKLIKLVVPFPAGGPTDTASRIVGQKLGERLGQAVIVDNRPGASGSIGASQVIKSPADGYTLMTLATPTLLAPHLFRKSGYDSSKDFAPVAMLYDLPIVVVVNPLLLPEVTDLPKLVAYAKQQKGAVNYTSAGTGSFGHLSMELLKQMAGFDMQHVPYKGSAPAITDTIGGQVPVMFADLVAALPHIQAGKLRAIAVGSPRRIASLPQVKTVSEQGFNGYEAVSWGGIVAPVGTPQPVIERIAKEVKLILEDKQVQDKMAGAGALPHFEPPAQFGERIRQDYQRWGQIIRDKGISQD